jgi:hypothetical protein
MKRPNGWLNNYSLTERPSLTGYLPWQLMQLPAEFTTHIVARAGIRRGDAVIRGDMPRFLWSNAA